LPRIGLLSGVQLNDGQFGAIAEGLSNAGFVDGRNVAIEHRWADEHNRLPVLAADLVHRQVDLILTVFGSATALAAKAATTTIPIVFVVGGDPVRSGLVSSLNRPGGNVTGVSFLVSALGAKRLGLLRELVPSIATVGYLINPTNSNSDFEINDMRRAAGALGVQVHVQNASNGQEIDDAFVQFLQLRVDALIVEADAVFLSRRNQLIELATRHAFPASYSTRDFVTAGGLMNYGTNLPDAFRAAGDYAGRILKGEKPADLPVLQSTKFELIINLKAAKAMGLKVPLTLQAAADEVIE
jgi:putative ABC transport system substrate-binding protein